MRRRYVAVCGAAATIAIGAVGAAVVADNDAAQPNAANEVITTEPVARQALTVSNTFDARATDRSPYQVTVQRSGVVTGVPDTAAELRPGDELIRIDEVPVVWASGPVPMYRTLEPGSTGADVAQLQEFLNDVLDPDEPLGVDGEFGPRTTRSVRDWQGMVGLEESGRVSPAHLVFVDLPRLRVTSAPAVGASTTGPTIDVTDATRVVTFTTDPSEAKSIETAHTVEVTVGSRTLPAAHVEVRTPDAPTASEQEVIVYVDEHLESSAEVVVRVTTILAENALTVPSRAIIAFADGGYGVEALTDQGSTTFVPVELGEFANGYVQVEGDLAEGDEVVVPT